MDPDNERGEEAQSVPGACPDSGRNYAGVHITAPPRGELGANRTMDDLAAELDRSLFSKRSFGRSQQARILTGAALFGVIVVVLLHEFGHWLTGLLVTGQAPDYLFVAVRQKTTEFSTFGGILTWGAGPLLNLVAIWVAIIFMTSRSRTYPRLFAATGGAIIFTVIVHMLNWAGATFTSPADWGNDLPRVATFFGSWARFWMHVMSAGFMVAVLLPTYVWITVARTASNQGLYLTPTVLGAVQGGILVVIITFFVALSE